MLDAAAHRIANTPVGALMPADVAEAIGIIEADPRTRRVERTEGHRLLVEIEDTIDGTLTGTHSVGRILNAMHDTQAGFAAKAEQRRAARAAAARAKIEQEAEALTQRERKDAELAAAGVSRAELEHIARRMRRGLYVDHSRLALWTRYGHMLGLGVVFRRT